jgi:serine/threonine-protein kinase
MDGSAHTLRVEVLVLDTGERKTIIEGGGNPAHYAPSGHLVYAEAGSILAAPFDLERLELTGAPIPVVDDVAAAHFSLSGNGDLVYVPGGEQDPLDVTLVWVDQKGMEESISDQRRRFVGPKLSPDGDRIAMWMLGGNPQVWIYDMTSGTLTPLTSEGQNFFPIWSPDGKRLVFPSMRSGGTTVNLFWKPADGSGAAERLTTSEYGQQPYSWSHDGKRILFHQSVDPETGFDIWMLPIEDDGKVGLPEPFLNTTADELHPALSPDDRWLAYVSDVSGRNEVFVTPFPGPGVKMMISTDGGVHPAWAPSGRELFYLQAGPAIRTWFFRMMAVNIVAKPELQSGKPRVLFEGPYSPGPIYGRCYDVTSDGQRFVLLKSPDYSAPQQINVILNWFEELERLVPTNN